MTANLEMQLARRQRGQIAAVGLDVLEPVLADQERALLDRLVGLFDAERLTPERALAGIGALSEFRKVVATLRGQVREGDTAAEAAMRGGARRA